MAPVCIFFFWNVQVSRYPPVPFACHFDVQAPTKKNGESILHKSPKYKF